MKIFKQVEGEKEIFPMDRFIELWKKKLLRDDLVLKYSWAVPNKKALLEISKYSPLIEIGARTGYWAMLLANLGADIICFDNKLPSQDENINNSSKVQYFSINKGSATILKNYLERNLFLCWIPHLSSLGSECLNYFKGKYLIYVGEWVGGCNATKGFFKELEKRFIVVETMKIPQWYGVRDFLTVLKNKQVD